MLNDWIMKSLLPTTFIVLFHIQLASSQTFLDKIHLPDTALYDCSCLTSKEFNTHSIIISPDGDYHRVKIMPLMNGMYDLLQIVNDTIFITKGSYEKDTTVIGGNLKIVKNSALKNDTIQYSNGIFTYSIPIKKNERKHFLVLSGKEISKEREVVHTMFLAGIIKLHKIITVDSKNIYTYRMTSSADAVHLPYIFSITVSKENGILHYGYVGRGYDRNFFNCYRRGIDKYILNELSNIFSQE